MKASVDEMVSAYQQHKNLRMASAALGMKLQTLYWNLRKAGVSCVGDKETFGSSKDRFAGLAERRFLELVPFAEDQNKNKFQARIDFLVGDIKVEVKAAKRNCLGVGKGGDRWAFSIKKQKAEADMFAMFAYSQDKCVERIYLIPGGLIASKTSISIPCNGKSKWHDYAVTEGELTKIMADMSGMYQ